MSVATASPQRRSPLIVLFALTIFVSAFLLFQVQPLLAKFILPWFGGSPAVWTTCMLVFQILLFAGYAYAHGISQWFSTRQQVIVHAVLLCLAVVALPIVPEADWKPTGGESPTLRIVLLLVTTVGLPYFLLSSTGPLLQRWFCSVQPGVSPYRLYALSNLGSLLALISFPFVVEPLFASTQQAKYWSVLFSGFALCCGACAWFVGRRTSCPAETDTVELQRSGGRVIATATYLQWFALAMLPSVMLLATTNQVCLDVAVIPFLWVVPLIIYLVSFILTFDSDRWYHRQATLLAAAISLAATSLVAAHGVALPVILQIGVFFTNLFLVCMLCHGELVQRKPDPSRLTSFYLTISAGGAAGGLFVALLAPHIFGGYHELNLGMLGCMLVCIGNYLRNDARWRERVPFAAKAWLAGAIVMCAFAYFVFFAGREAGTLEVRRNFYGISRVKDDVDASSGKPLRKLVHGRIIHGWQFQTETDRQRPTTYFAPHTAVGRTLSTFRLDQARHVGIIGLGAGTLASYGRAGDRFRFYEIDADVMALAREYFTFLSESDAKVSCVLGDARLMLERESDQQFDVLILDAFSGDAVPVHLLTAEAMKIYTRHLRPDGLLCVHFSNLHFDLEPVVRGLAESFGYSARVHLSDPRDDMGAMPARWIVLAKDPATLVTLLGPSPEKFDHQRLILWTDDRSNLLQVLR